MAIWQEVVKLGILSIIGKIAEEDVGRMDTYGARDDSHKSIVPPLALLVSSGRSGK